MRNALISIFLFLAIMCSLFFFNKSVINLCDNIINKSNEINNSLLEDDLERSYYLSIDLKNTLESKSAITSIYLNHTDFDNLINEVIKLSIYILNEDRSEAMTSLNLLQANAQHLRNLQIPKLENVL